jgi:hypothetical protein
MSILVGAFFPFIMGKISDLSNIQWAYAVPVVGGALWSVYF